MPTSVYYSDRKMKSKSITFRTRGQMFPVGTEIHVRDGSRVALQCSQQPRVSERCLRVFSGVNRGFLLGGLGNILFLFYPLNTFVMLFIACR